MDSGSSSNSQDSSGPSAGSPRRATASGAAELDRSLARLADAAPRLGQLSAPERARLLRSIARRIHETSERIVELDCIAKGLPKGPVTGEPMFDGPAIVLRYASELARTLEGDARLGPESVRVERGRTIAEVLPRDGHEQLLFPFWRAEAWFDGEVPAERIATRPDELPSAGGSVSLVLGAGNVTSIGVVDAIQQCFVHGRACLLKMSPVNDYLGPLLELAFAPLVENGWFSFAYGGRDVGEYLVRHENVDRVHVTGAYETHEAIVWGPPAERAARKARGEPFLDKPVTSELGNVSPVIVVPGPYEASEIEHAARSIVGTFVFNAGFNCNATKLVVTPRGTDLRDRLLRAMTEILEETPPRLAFYPGAVEKYRRFARAGRLQSFGGSAEGVLPWAFVTELDAGAEEDCFGNEPFCAVLSEVAVSSGDPLEFMAEATRFVNERVWGTLNAMLVVPRSIERDPTTAAALDRCLADLRYGSVCVNVWPAAAYGLGTLPWGGHPSATPESVQSGLGWGHNALLLGNVEKTVLRGPLLPFPKPLWYPGHRTLDTLARGFANYSARPSAKNLARLAFAAVRG
jgi:aldehyde dehydrogenase (NAD(P)+)